MLTPTRADPTRAGPNPCRPTRPIHPRRPAPRILPAHPARASCLPVEMCRKSKAPPPPLARMTGRSSSPLLPRYIPIGSPNHRKRRKPARGSRAGRAGHRAGDRAGPASASAPLRRRRAPARPRLGPGSTQAQPAGARAGFLRCILRCRANPGANPGPHPGHASSHQTRICSEPEANEDAMHLQRLRRRHGSQHRRRKARASRPRIGRASGNHRPSGRVALAASVILFCATWRGEP